MYNDIGGNSDQKINLHLFKLCGQNIFFFYDVTQLDFPKKKNIYIIF